LCYLLSPLGAKEQKEKLWTEDKDRKARNTERIQRSTGKEEVGGYKMAHTR
jgi:hypothetical protein